MAAFTPDAIQQAVDHALEFFVPSNPYNHTGKYIHDWSTADLKKLPNEDLTSLRVTLADEQYTMTDKILPKGLSREDFYRAIIRESARRDILKNNYIEPLLKNIDHVNKIQQPVQVMRAAFTYGDATANAVPVPVRQLAGVVAMHDMAVDAFLNSDPDGLHIQPDFAAAVGLDKDGVLPLHTDVRAYDFGYLAGSRPEFNKDDALNITAHFEYPIEKVQEGYCKETHEIFQEGTKYATSANVLAGFVQGRFDSRTKFEPVTEHVGLIAECTH